MSNALVIYLLIVSIGIYLIARFFFQKAILHLMAGIGIILIPGFMTAAKLISAAETLPAVAKGGIAVVATAVFAFFTYISGYASIGIRRQWEEPKYRPTPVDVAAYALAVVLLMAFAAAVFG